MLNFLKKLSQRTINIISIILEILTITPIASLVMCLVFGFIGKFANLSFMISLAGFCLLIFIISGVALIIFGLLLIICFIIDSIKRGGLKNSLKILIPTFVLLFLILIIIHIFKPDLLIPILLFTIFILPAIGYYIWFWKKNKLWMLLIAANSQTAAFNHLKEIVPDNFNQLYRLADVTIGLGLLAIMGYRYWKINKEKS